MSKYLFLLGKASDLCFEELTKVLKYKGIEPKRISQNVAESELKNISPNDLINVLGGTVKIAKIIKSNPEKPQELITHDLSKAVSRPNFSILGLSPDVYLNIKSSLKSKGISSRFSQIKNIYQTAVSKQKNYHEYWFIKEKNSSFLAKAEAFQNIDEWSKKDFKRPKSDPKSGMLPPKIARIMVNLSVSPFEKNTIYDPFCGSGTILAEAMSLGHDVVGSDISPKAINDSRENLSWIKSTFSLDSSFYLFQKEVAHVKHEDLKTDIDAIVFEPFMGPPVINQHKIKNIVKGLTKLYIGTLRNCEKLQISNQKLVLILPEFRFKDRKYTTDTLIDRCENFGYTRQAGPFKYDRPTSTVVRRIYTLVKK